MNIKNKIMHVFKIIKNLTINLVAVISAMIIALITCIGIYVICFGLFVGTAKIVATWLTLVQGFMA